MSPHVVPPFGPSPRRKSGARRTFLLQAILGPLALTIALTSAGATEAAAGLCGSRTDLIALLTKHYGESPSAVGLTGSGRLVEVLTAADGATWSIIMTMPNGVSCLMAAGKDWQDRAPVVSREPRV